MLGIGGYQKICVRHIKSRSRYAGGQRWRESGDGGRISVKAELLGELFKEYREPQDFEEIFKQFRKTVAEGALGAELNRHLRYNKCADEPRHRSNHRNGSNGKRISTDQGSLEIEVPRDLKL
jgi:hypothetical protein